MLNEVKYKVEINPSYEWIKGAKEGGVSHRELEVLALLADGYDNEEIADILQIKYQSVKNHTYALNKKLKAFNIAQALAIAIANNMIRIEKESVKPEYTTSEKFMKFLSKAVVGEDTELTKKIKKWLIRHGVDVDI